MMKKIEDKSQPVYPGLASEEINGWETGIMGFLPPVLLIDWNHLVQTWRALENIFV